MYSQKKKKKCPSQWRSCARHRERASVERAWRGKNSTPPVRSCSRLVGGRGKFRTCWQQVFPSIVTRLHGLSFTRGRTKFPQHLLRNISNLPASPNFPPLSSSSSLLQWWLHPIGGSA